MEYFGYISVDKNLYFERNGTWIRYYVILFQKNVVCKVFILEARGIVLKEVL